MTAHLEENDKRTDMSKTKTPWIRNQNRQIFISWLHSNYEFVLIL